MEEQDAVQESQESIPQEEEPRQEKLDGGAKIILSLGCLGSLALGCILAYGGIVVGIWLLHRPPGSAVLGAATQSGRR